MKHKNKRPTDPETLALQAELKAAQSDLALAYRQFDQATAPELVESCVYRISAGKSPLRLLSPGSEGAGTGSRRFLQG